MNHSSYPERRPSSPVGVRPGAPHPPKLDQKLTAEEINRLAIMAFRGSIHVVCTRPQMLAAVRELRRETLLGFDTEKRPSFRKGETHPPALIQLAGRDAVYVFQLQALGFPVELTDILANSGIVKAGVSVARDIQELWELLKSSRAVLWISVTARSEAASNIMGFAAWPLSFWDAGSRRALNLPIGNDPIFLLPPCNMQPPTRGSAGGFMRR